MTGDPEHSATAGGIVVVIPCWNVEKTLPRQLAALDQQTDLDFRVVISDNGSTDGTRAVAEGWFPKHRGIEVVDSAAVQGVAHARNAAIRACDEPLILICDGDDAVHPGWVAAMRDGLSRDACVTGPLELVFPDDPDRRETWNETSVPNSMRFRTYMPGCNIGMRREVFEAVDGFDETLATGQEDVDFGWRLQDHGFTIGHHPEASIAYYQRSGWKAFLRQQWRYGRAHVNLHLRHRHRDLPTASAKSSARWFLEWAKQLPGAIRRGELRDKAGAFVFQIARVIESAKHRTRSPLG